MSDKPLNCVGIDPEKQRIGSHDFRQSGPSSPVASDFFRREETTIAPKRRLVERTTKKLEVAICYALGGNALAREDDYRRVYDAAPYLARAALDACHAEDMLAALNRLTAAVGVMLNVYLADEEKEIELCQDTEHHLAILELRGAFDAATRVETALLAKLNCNPMEGAVDEMVYLNVYHEGNSAWFEWYRTQELADRFSNRGRVLCIALQTKPGWQAWQSSEPQEPVPEASTLTEEECREVIDLMGEAAYWANNGCGDPKEALPMFRPLMAKALVALFKRYTLMRKP